MYPKFLMHQDDGLYIKINNSDGDGILIIYNEELICTNKMLLFKELDSYSAIELVKLGYSLIEKNFFFETYERVLNRHTKQLIL